MKKINFLNTFNIVIVSLLLTLLSSCGKDNPLSPDTIKTNTVYNTTENYHTNNFHYTNNFYYYPYNWSNILGRTYLDKDFGGGFQRINSDGTFSNFSSYTPTYYTTGNIVYSNLEKKYFIRHYITHGGYRTNTNGTTNFYGVSNYQNKYTKVCWENYGWSSEQPMLTCKMYLKLTEWTTGTYPDTKGWDTLDEATNSTGMLWWSIYTNYAN